MGGLGNIAKIAADSVGLMAAIPPLENKCSKIEQFPEFLPFLEFFASDFIAKIRLIWCARSDVQRGVSQSVLEF